MPGYTAPIVKAEVVEDLDAPAQAAPKAEDEVADYGGPEEDGPKPEGAPVRAMADYGDLLDDDVQHVARGAPKEAKEEDDVKRAMGAAVRKNAIHVSGVQRLTRTHLSEIFDSKNLPEFKWVEWTDDDKVVCVFASEEDAAAALRGCKAGFGDAIMEDDAPPGPGLWRAQRCMLDFRLATEADQPAADWKKQHRGGRQVREYRFWEAVKDLDKHILTGLPFDVEDAQGLKRPAPSGEDAIAAADWDDDSQRRKRLRRGPGPGEEEEEIDLLNKMAALDKTILTKEEAGEPALPPKASDVPLLLVKLEEEAGGGSATSRARGWEHDDRGRAREEWWDDWDWGGDNSWGDDGWAWNPRQRRRGGGQDQSWEGAGGGRGKGRPSWGGGGGGGGDRGPDGGGEGGAPAAAGPAGGKIAALPLDGAEAERRARRAERFSARPIGGGEKAPDPAPAAAPAAPATATAGAS